MMLRRLLCSTHSTGISAPGCAMSERSHVEAQVELMALPEDVPDEQPVVCGSKSGTFLTRTQRVVLDGVEMSASRFEQVR
jgi:hypothetical protein